MRRFSRLLFSVVLLLIAQSSCYGDPLRQQVKDAAKDIEQDQKAVLRVLDETLQNIRTKYSLPETTLSTKYEDLRQKYNLLADRTKSFIDRIDEFKDLCGKLLSEWQTEAGEMADQELKSKSLHELENSKKKQANYLKRLDEGMNKLLSAQRNLKDKILFIKHLLNAETLNNLDPAVDEIEDGIEDLIADMGELLEETQHFINHET